MKITQSKSALFLGMLLFIGPALEAAAATFTVTNTNDSGPGSLRQAVLDANAVTTHDSIVFDSSFNTARTITLATVIQISVTNAVKTLTITGPGAALLTISGNNATRIFTTEPEDTVAMSGMTLTRGNGNNGGAINTSGHLTLTNVNFTENVTNSGGAIYNAGNGTTSGVLRIEGCVFTNNQTTGTNINGDGGSAVESNSGNVTINHSIMTGGTTRGGGGAIRNNGAMAITNSTISNNTSGGAGNSDGGGAIHNSGTMALTNSTIMNNTAGENTAGGGIVNSFRLTIVNSTITGNAATEQGGGIYAGGSGVSGEFVNITSSIISNNVANTGTGSTTFGNGGGIWIQGGMTTTIVGSTISGNTATAIPGGSVTRQGNGGGIYTDGPLTLKNSTVSGNFAGNSYGGIQDSNPGGSGDVVTLINTTITNNTAQGNVGGFGVDSVSDAGQQAVRNTIIAGNIATGTSHDVFGSITSEGYNLIGNTTGATIIGTTTGNIYNVDPLLGPLASNGGPTQTHALMVGSPAIDQGKSADLVTDQRGLPRPYDNTSIPNASGGDGSDIGAFEDQPPNTLTGNNITTHAPAGDATVTFPSVSQAGFTTFIPIVPPSLAGTPPQGYTILDDAPAYDITTTATFTPPIIVGFTVASITSPAEFARVRILRAENGQLVDRTILAPDSPPPDFATRAVYARVDSLSSFVIALAPAAAQLLNVSTRMRVQTGDNVLIGGFIISGNVSKRVIIRAIGPSLTDFGIAGALADPVLELNGPAGFAPVTNNDWRDTQQAEIEATGIPPSNNLESAIVATLAPGAYTAVVRGQNGGTGVGLVEAYDLEAAVDAKLANISTRGFVEAGENVMIGGLVAGGGASGQMLVRAIGPSLLAFGVANALEDPTLELRDGSGALVASNDDWRDTQQTAIEATGIPPTHNKESAILSTLAPGIYTAIVRGVSDTTGVGLVEVYNLN